jgi:transcriptional regulator with XRE-family HTH domain
MGPSNRNRVATLGQKVRSYRLAVGLSQDELARRATVAQAVISRIERDETDDPGIHQVALIAAVLGRPLEDLVSDEGLYAPRIASAKRNSVASTPPDSSGTDSESGSRLREERVERLEADLRAMREIVDRLEAAAPKPVAGPKGPKKGASTG